MGVKWDKDPSAFVDDVEKEINKNMRKLVLTIFNNVVALSPVGLQYGGTYRNAHHISQGSPSYAMSGATSVNIAVGDYRTIYIQNNLPYSLRIEHGWSGQAPTGVYGNAVNSAMASM